MSQATTAATTNQRLLAWVEETAATLRDGPGAYVSFLGVEGDARVHEAYPGATYDRLAAIKARYDPENLFRSTHNIAPSANA